MSIAKVQASVSPPIVSSGSTALAASAAPLAAGGLKGGLLSALRDLRFGWRSLIRNPLSSGIVVLVLTLGIGANTAIFTLVNSILLRPLPFAAAEELVSVWPEGAFQLGGFPIVEEQNRSFSAFAGYGMPEKVSLTGEAGPARLTAISVSPELFPLLGVQPAAGRIFSAEEDQPGRPAIVLLSHRGHQRLFAGDPDRIGKTITLDGKDHEVVGVMPASFTFPSPEVDLWRPAVADPSQFGSLWSGTSALRGIGRLQSGVTPERAQEELRSLMPQLRDAFPWPMPDEYGSTATVAPLQESLVGETRSYLLLLWAAVGLVLLIACVNIANLLLVRAQGRQREMAVRAATGAPRGRLMRQLVTESLLLGALGGLGGLALGWAALQLLHLPGGLPRVEEVALDGRVLLVACALALGTGLIFGLLPALRASRVDLQTVLKDGGGSAGPGRSQRRLVASLVVCEIALTVVLAVGAGALIRSFWAQVQTDPGFQPAQRVTATVAPPEFRYDSDEKRRAVYGQLTAQIRQLPGVESVGWTDRLPFKDDSFSSVFLIEGRPQPTGNDWPMAEHASVVDEGFFQALGIPLIAGRGFEASDRADAPGVVVVSESLAQRYWPGENAVSKRIRFPRQEQWMTVVGVVADIRQASLTEAPVTALYSPIAQRPVGPLSVVVQSTAAPSTVLAALRQQVASVDGDTPVSDLGTLDGLISSSLTQPRITMLLLGGFAAIALLLAALGIYGVTASMVHQRRRELALRVALGASPRRVLRLVLRRGLGLVAIGLLLGLPAALALAGLLRSLLYGVGAADPLTLGAVVLLLAATAVAASYLPARRALQVEAGAALRAD